MRRQFDEGTCAWLQPAPGRTCWTMESRWSAKSEGGEGRRGRSGEAATEDIDAKEQSGHGLVCSGSINRVSPMVPATMGSEVHGMVTTCTHPPTKVDYTRYMSTLLGPVERAWSFHMWRGAPKKGQVQEGSDIHTLHEA